jgi:5-oxopent-3-ene-1,2,5-tricarboxylate decarboxylase/2-hydroxyhepta-2,4-diene-1,7-dioate isomerase
MKRARIAYNGAIHDVAVEDGQVILADGRRVAEQQVVWLPPVEVGTAFALAINYADHAKELAFKAPEKPLAFIKGPGTFIGHRAQTRRPDDAAFMHYECELAVVIGCSCRNVAAADALDFVGGQIASVSKLLAGIPLPQVAGLQMRNLSVSADDGYVMVKGELE